MATITKTLTKDMHFSGSVVVDGQTVVTMDAGFDVSVPEVPIINRYISNGKTYRQNKKEIDAIVDEFENNVWDEYDRATSGSSDASGDNTTVNK